MPDRPPGHNAAPRCTNEPETQTIKNRTIMAQNQFSMDLNLKAYPNTLTPDVDDDYTVKVDTQSTPLNLDDIARATASAKKK